MTIGIASNETIFSSHWIDRRQFVSGEHPDTKRWLLRNYLPWKKKIYELWVELGAPGEITQENFSYMRSKLAALIMGSDEDTRAKTMLIPEQVLEHLLEINRFRRNMAGNFESKKTETEILKMKKEKAQAETQKIQQETADLRSAAKAEREKLELELKIEKAQTELTEEKLDRVTQKRLAAETKLQDELRKEDTARTKTEAAKKKKGKKK